MATSRRLGSLCEAQVASTTDRQPLPPPALTGPARHQRQPPPAWLGQVPAAHAHDGVEAACHGGAADRHRGQSPFNTAAFEPTTEDRQPRLQRLHNVLPLCRGAEGDVGHERRVTPAKIPFFYLGTSRRSTWPWTKLIGAPPANSSATPGSVPAGRSRPGTEPGEPHQRHIKAAELSHSRQGLLRSSGLKP